MQGKEEWVVEIEAEHIWRWPGYVRRSEGVPVCMELSRFIVRGSQGNISHRNVGELHQSKMVIDQESGVIFLIRRKSYKLFNILPHG